MQVLQRRVRLSREAAAYWIPRFRGGRRPFAVSAVTPLLRVVEKPKNRAGLSTRIFRSVAASGAKRYSSSSSVAFVRRLLHRDRMRPVAAPDAAIGRGLDIGAARAARRRPTAAPAFEIFSDSDSITQKLPRSSSSSMRATFGSAAPQRRIGASHVVEQHRHVERLRSRRAVRRCPSGSGWNFTYQPSSRMRANARAKSVPDEHEMPRPAGSEARAADAGVVQPREVAHRRAR